MIRVVITDMAVQDNNELPQLMKDDVKVKQGKTMYTVTQLIPARDQAAGLQSMILIDETLNIQARQKQIELDATYLSNVKRASEPEPCHHRGSRTAASPVAEPKPSPSDPVTDK